MPHLHKLAGIMIVCAFVAGLFLAPDRERPATQAAGSAPGGPAAAKPARPAPRPPAKIGVASATAKRVRANELGEIPVLMYHRIVPKVETSLDRTPAELRAELEQLAKGGYVPITAAEFVSGRFNVPAGRHPVVLTFDDASPSQFGLDGHGNPNRDSAVAILDEVGKRHPGFRPVATFFINAEPFQLAERAGPGLRWLRQRGHEIANHTFTHADLSRLSREKVEEEISRVESLIVSLGGAHATTLAFPFGSAPKKPEWARRKAGAYEFQGLFLAGWRPSPSPFSTDFDRTAISRIRSKGKIKEGDCMKFCSTAWLEWLDKNPGKRYTSDGDPKTIAFPAMESDRLHKGLLAWGRSY
ncbi:polysaccharide deacetylase [Actinomadura craniellae]|uniref:Polysaccharide deacetylase n=1 Tax=Actinomadura craniellae TaxID=2231787 RepID=A0A365HC63_9ACTN|nr:polysaccharide deacetylase family protein [Actinomadura craniellae]RAY16602.1 polysaccharide deacetylase [Actinomadura craniellae]